MEKRWVSLALVREYMDRVNKPIIRAYRGQETARVRPAPLSPLEHALAYHHTG